MRTDAVQRVDVPTEDGRVAVIEFEHRRPGFWSIDVSDELVGLHPQAIGCALAIALSQMRREGQDRIGAEDDG